MVFLTVSNQQYRLKSTRPAPYRRIRRQSSKVGYTYGPTPVAQVDISASSEVGRSSLWHSSLLHTAHFFYLRYHLPLQCRVIGVRWWCQHFHSWLSSPSLTIFAPFRAPAMRLQYTPSTSGNHKQATLRSYLRDSVIGRSGVSLLRLWLELIYPRRKTD